MLITRVFSRSDKRFARIVASASLLALSHLSLAQAGEQTPPLPPGTITVEETHYKPAAPGVPQVPATSSRPTAEGMVDAAKRDIGKIDRDLRKDAPPKDAKAAEPTMQQKLEMGLAPAAPPPPSSPKDTTMEDITLPNGQRVTKVTGPNGTYCVTQISVGNTKGEDIMQKGAISRTTSCGSGF
jgi:hypothetical protein